MRYRLYLTIVFVMAGLPLAAVGWFNLWIDPFDSGNALASSRFQHARSVESTRTLKFNQLTSKRWDFVIVGTSRAELGIDPRDQALNHLGQGYNVALPGSNLFEADHVVRSMLQHDSGGTVFALVDLVMFGEYRLGVDDFLRSGFAHGTIESSLEATIRRTFGASTVRASWQTWNEERLNRHEQRLFQGFRQSPSDVGNAYSFSFDIARYYATAPEALYQFTYAEDRVNDLRQLIRRCSRNNVDVYLIVPPIHALQLGVIDRLGLSATFDRMKNDLVEVADEERRNTRSHSKIEVWDFSGFAGVVSEPIPLKNGDRPMQYFYEISHFRPIVGATMMAMILGREPDSKLELVGEQLNRENIEAHLAAQRERRDVFLQSQSAKQFLDDVFSGLESSTDRR